MAKPLIEQLKGKRVGVVMSAGYFGFFGHAGFMTAINEAGLTPTAFAGTSAGGMIAAFSAAGLHSAPLKALLLQLKRADFWDPGLRPILKALVGQPSHVTGLLQGDRFLNMLRSALPVQTFEALKTPLLLVATNLSHHAPELLSEGDLASAILATCAYPGMFQAVRRGPSLLWDGGIVDKAPAVAAADFFSDSIDALLVHYLPSHDEKTEPQGLAAYASGIAAGMSALRHEHFKLQIELLKARKVPTWVITSHLPAVSPRKLELGADAWAQARQLTTERLNQVHQMWLPNG